MNKKILIIEDEPKVSKAYSDHLGRVGYNVSLAHDGEEGLRMIKNNKPDLILLDIIMPVMDGLTMLKLLKADKDKNIANIPVIILSNLDTADSVAEAVASGSTNFLVKSNYSLEQLDAKVLSMLK